MNVVGKAQSWVDRFVPEVLFEDTDSLRKGRLIVFSSLLVAFLGVIYLIVFYWLSHAPGMVLCAYGSTSSIFCIYLLNRKADTDFTGTYYAAAAFAFFAAFSLMTHGIETGIAIWILMAPLSALLMVNMRAAFFWSLMSLAFLAGLFCLYHLDIALPTAFERELIPLLNFVSIVGFLLYGVFSILGNEQVKQRALKDLKASNQSIQDQQVLLRQKNEEILAANMDLEAKIAQRTLKLQLSNEELDTFLYESSHALRRPLVRILGLTNIVRIANTEKERNTYLQNIEFTAQGMDSMLQDLLKVSQINNRSLSKRHLRATSFFKHVIKDLFARNDFGKVDIQVDLSQNWLLEVDSFMLRAAVEAILLNAIQYRKPHEPVCRIRITEQLNGSGLSFVISDCGQGIHPHALRDVFKMFSKGTEKSNGSGLGLYIAQKAMHRVNSSISISSQQGVGTQLTLTFPPYLVEQVQTRHPARKANPEAVILGK